MKVKERKKIFALLSQEFLIGQDNQTERIYPENKATLFISVTNEYALRASEFKDLMKKLVPVHAKTS